MKLELAVNDIKGNIKQGDVSATAESVADATSAFAGQAVGRIRRTTVREGAASGETRKKYPEEEKELQGDIEGKSPFQCSYGPRFHGAQEKKETLD